jgi:hypothetical protein
MAEIVDPFAMECSTLLAHRREQYPDPSAPRAMSCEIAERWASAMLMPSMATSLPCRGRR